MDHIRLILLVKKRTPFLYIVAIKSATFYISFISYYGICYFSHKVCTQSNYFHIIYTFFASGRNKNSILLYFLMNNLVIISQFSKLFNIQNVLFVKKNGIAELRFLFLSSVMTKTLSVLYGQFVILVKGRPVTLYKRANISRNRYMNNYITHDWKRT